MSGTTERRRRTSRRRATVTISSAALLGASFVPLTVATADPGSASDLGSAESYGITADDSSGPALTSPTGAWFIQVPAAPTARGGSDATIESQIEAVERDAESLDVELEVRETFTELWAGFSVAISDEDAVVVAEADSVEAIYPVLTVDAPPEPSASVPDMLSALALTGADIAQSELGYTGEGIRIGVIDSGVDYNHTDLGGSGVKDPANFPNDKVVTGYDFVGDDFNADASDPAYNPIPSPSPDPDDCGGHGTHVAGIAAADGDTATGGVRGVAPDAEIGAYRVFGCEGSTTSDIILSALELALADGMDVVNMSLGAAFQSWPQYPTAVASDNLVDAGVVVVASIGNSGTSGLYAAGAPGVGEKVIGVASYDNTYFSGNSVVLAGEATVFNPASAAPAPPTSGQLPLTSAGDPGTPGGLACTSEEIEGDITGSAVLIQRGDCSFYEKALAAQQSGAAAVVLYNNVPGLLTPTVAGEQEITIPVILVDQAEGLDAVDAVAEGDAILEWTDETVRAPNPSGGLLSDFSSFGLGADLNLKPDLGAPGGSIWSTLPVDGGTYGSNSGTSMSSPHVAGAVALYLQAHPGSSPEHVRDTLQNTAEPALFSLNPDLGLLDTVNRQGAGMIQIDEAILEGVTVSPGKLSLGESEHGPVTETITVTNTGEETVTYALSFEDAVAATQNVEAGFSAAAPGFVFAVSTVELPESITVGAGETVTFDVSISPNTAYDQVQYGGYIYLQPDEGADLSIAYAGFAGDYQSLPILLPTANSLPALTELVGCDRLLGVDCVIGASWDFVDEGHVYSMADGDVPTILAQVGNPVQNLRIDVYKANADGTRGAPVHPRYFNYLDTDFVGRTGGGVNTFNVWTWDGSVSVNAGERQVPDGDYILVVTAVNALGDAANPDHVEQWETAAFTVDRDGDGNPPPLSPFELLIKKLGKVLATLLCLIFGVCSP